MLIPTFGVEVVDNYRWLEDDLSEETAQWVKQQNEVTFDFLNQIPIKNALKERLTEIWNYEKLSPHSNEVITLIFIKMTVYRINTLFIEKRITRRKSF